MGRFYSPHCTGQIFEAFAKGDILQILFFAILFGFGLSRMGETGQSVITTFDKLSKVFFNMMKIVMKVAPIGAFGGMAYTISTYGLATLKPLALLMGSVYLTMFLFIFVVLNIICYLFKFSLWQYLKHIKEEILIVLGTSSSESALPGMMEKAGEIRLLKISSGIGYPGWVLL
jgi:aerobic C4-dicarboxylate transport protein